MEDRTSRPPRVIIVDDHPLFRVALGSLLRKNSDLEVVAEAADGRQAIELCVRFRPDLVLMDVRMPGMDGLETTRAIKREHPSTVVLILSAYGDADLLAEALEAGASGYVLKTASLQEITDAIQRVLESASPLDAGSSTELLLRLMGQDRKERPSLVDPKRPHGGEHARTPLSAALTRREVEVLRLLARGHTNAQIARDLLVSKSTVKKHVQRIISKLKVSGRTQAAVKAHSMGLLDDRE
jgi:NarL family two-component system response regulator LiaR